ncbi:MAG: DNA polymerase III subunit gamma/tau [Firmicutes bacterium]|nr:DNA polymerase III subunit gamma/tau [Bacillota bacterium]
MYQALYRKYRPKNFDEIVGQDIIVKTLKNTVVNEKMTHAYLFTGPRGTGKTSIAKILAKTINCENLKNGIPCDECVSCTQINNKQTVDIIEIDAASNNGVDEIRELKSKVNLVPSNSKYKVYIIDEVHMLTTGAFNALLKTLEEPPMYIIFILATTEPHKIPTTILSRCQRFDFKRINNNSLIMRLNNVCNIEKIDIEENAVKEIARISDGGMRDALSILDQVYAYSDGKITVDDVHTVNGTLTDKQLRNFIMKIIDGNLLEIMEMIDNWNETGKNFAKILEDLILYFKNLLIFQQAPEYLISKGVDIDIYKDLTMEKSIIIKNIEVLNKNLTEIKKTNMPKLIFEISILKIVTIKEEKKENEENSSNEKINDVGIKETFKKEQIIGLENKINSDIKEKLKKIKQIRINNALSTFDKKELIKIKDLHENLKPLLINPDYSQVVSVILDGTLKAAGKNYLVYVFENETNSDLFNQYILKIEDILETQFGNKYNVISTDIISWEIIKEEYNSRTKQYQYIEEDVDIKQIFNETEEKNEIENLFFNTIQYN